MSSKIRHLPPLLSDKKLDVSPSLAKSLVVKTGSVSFGMTATVCLSGGSVPYPMIGIGAPLMAFAAASEGAVGIKSSPSAGDGHAWPKRFP